MDVAAETDLDVRLGALMLRDSRRLRRRLEGVRAVKDPDKRAAAMATLTRTVEAAQDRTDRRRAAVPQISYPDSLPVAARRDDIMAAVRDAQVVIVAGETGSGKTTQLPKMCLELGRGVRGLIGHTQPRRIAARAVADRVSEELGTPLGAVVGYKVRFTDTSSDQTLLKVMTDGILLAEIQTDRELLAYDTLIIDEAHERSLNIDFILGYLKQLLPRRPDLKVVITSATIDVARFAAHFDAAPVIEVSGRTFPVEVRYRPLVDDAGEETADVEPHDQVRAICEAVEELWTDGSGDVLVFLSGEREIRDTAEALRGLLLPDTEILPLYARLSAAEQHRVFASHPGRRVVLATNVAETSLTVPGIRYVVDPGMARVSRYSTRLKVQRLPIEAVSRASADQRKGRCGRVADGICIRLYSEEDYLARPEFTDPEILRTNLASVILQMTAIGLGDIAAFPFVEPPDRRNVKDGVQLLEELGALDPAQSDPRKRLTALGRRLALLPLDPRLARMVLEADRNGCVREVLVITAALSIQDPRERPQEKQQAADQLHRRFADGKEGGFPGADSDFLTYLRLWDYLREQQRELSSSAFRRLCKAEFLNYLRVREWQDVYAQLRQLLKSLDVTLNSTPADADRVHQSLLSGLLSHVGLADPEKRDYLGARGARFVLWPGSSLARTRPRWVMAAELVETSRLWGRDVARIQPEWAEALAAHLVKRTYSEPHWEKDRGAVMGYERVTLYGLPLVARRKVPYARVDPELSRDLFIRNALVEGDWRTHHAFWHANQAMLEEIEELEHRVRRRDVVIDDETLVAFYDARLPADVVSARHFDAWWKKARRTQPDLLTFERSMLLRDDADVVSAEDYPAVWLHEGTELALSYQFEPGSDADGVTVQIPLPVLNRVTDAGFDWQIPGLRLDVVTALLRSLPKPVRVKFVPAPDVAKAALARLTPSGEAITSALGTALADLTGVRVAPADWDWGRVPDHLRITYRVVDPDTGAALGESKDLDELKTRLSPRLRRTVARAATSVEQRGLRSWTFGTLPRTFERSDGEHVIRGFPALVDEGDAVAIRVLDTVQEQERGMRAGTRRLLLLGLDSPVRTVLQHLPHATKLTLVSSPYPSVPTLLDDCVDAAVDALVAHHGGPAWDEPAFGRLRNLVRVDLVPTVSDTVTSVAGGLALGLRIERRLKATSNLALLASLTDIRAHLSRLLTPGFVSAVGTHRLPDLQRYLRALDHRLLVLPDHAARDRTTMSRYVQVQSAFDAALHQLPADRRDTSRVDDVRRMLEELRVSLFAQQIGTAYPVSEQRVRKAIAAL